MEKIHFIPDKQRGTFALSSSNDSVSFGLLVGILVLIMVLFTGSLYGVQYLFLEQNIVKIRENVAAIDESNKSLYPDSNLAGMIGTVSNLLQEESDVHAALMTIRSAYLPQARVKTVSYSKQSRNIRINVELESLESIIAQVEKLSTLPMIQSVEYSNFSASADNDLKMAELNITLK